MQTGELDLGIIEEWASPIDPNQWQQWFQTWLTTLEIQDPCELSLCLTGDEQIQSLNRTYRHQDQPTDVLAFAAEESGIPDLSCVRLLGDIVISVPTAERQAFTQGHPVTLELAWLAAHGLLHLLGWDHPDEEHLVLMLRQQQHLLHIVDLVIQENWV